MLKSSVSAALLCVVWALTPAMAAGPSMGRAPTPAPSPGAALPRAKSPESDTCSLASARKLIGGPSDAQTRARAATAVGHTRLRWIAPGMVITQDYRADRLNLILDDQGRVRTVRCG